MSDGDSDIFGGGADAGNSETLRALMDTAGIPKEKLIAIFKEVVNGEVVCSVCGNGKVKIAVPYRDRIHVASMLLKATGQLGETVEQRPTDAMTWEQINVALDEILLDDRVAVTILRKIVRLLGDRVHQEFAAALAATT